MSEETSGPDQRGTNKVLAARILVILDLAFCLFQSVLGVINVIDPPTTMCGRANPSFWDAVYVVAALVPLMVLGVGLVLRPTNVRSRTILAVVAVIALTVLALAIPLGYRFQNGFCIAPL